MSANFKLAKKVAKEAPLNDCYNSVLAPAPGLGEDLFQSISSSTLSSLTWIFSWSLLSNPYMYIKLSALFVITIMSGLTRPPVTAVNVLRSLALFVFAPSPHLNPFPFYWALRTKGAVPFFVDELSHFSFNRWWSVAWTEGAGGPGVIHWMLVTKNSRISCSPNSVLVSSIKFIVVNLKGGFTRHGLRCPNTSKNRIGQMGNWTMDLF